MATEAAGLTKRTGVVATTLKTVVSPDASGSDRGVALLKTVTVSGGLVTAGVVLTEEALAHASGPLSAMWSNASFGICAAGGAVAVGGIATAITHQSERTYRRNYGVDDSDAKGLREGARTTFRGVGGGATAIGGTAALIAAGMAIGHMVGGLPDPAALSHVLVDTAETAGAVGVVGLVLGSHWNRHIRAVTGTRQLSE